MKILITRNIFILAFLFMTNPLVASDEAEHYESAYDEPDSDILDSNMDSQTGALSTEGNGYEYDPNVGLDIEDEMDSQPSPKKHKKNTKTVELVLEKFKLTKKDVQKIQENLRKKGHKIKVDGLMGKKTYAALLKFQGHSINQELNPVTIEQLKR